MSDRRHALICSTLALVAVFASGCGAEPGGEQDPIGTAQQDIAGGYTDPGDTNVVGIYDNAVGGICSGSLLAPNMVLTAHHCVANIYNEVQGGVDCSQTSFGPPHGAGNFYVTTKGSMSMNPSDYHSVREVLVTPTDPKLCGQDQAILILNDLVQPTEATPLVPRVDTSLAKGDQYYAIGFGATNDSGSGVGTRRRRDNLFINCVEGECPAYYQSKPHEFVGDTGICGGDSGGPALDMQNRVVGVTSRGGAGCTSPIYGHVFGWGQWIKDSAVHAAELGGYAPPPWATGYPTDPAFSAPIGNACGQPADCPTNACVNDGYSQYCTRPCLDVAPCPDGYTCDANLQVCMQVHPKDEPTKKHKSSSSEDSGGCSVASVGPELDADPTKPIPWFTGGAAIGALALLGRRRARNGSRVRRRPAADLP